MRFRLLATRGMRRPRTAVVASVVAAVMAASLSVALADTLSSGSVSPQAFNAGARATPVATADPADAAAFGILRQPVVAADAIPAAMMPPNDATNDEPSVGMMGANYALARKTTGLGGAGEAWVIPGDGVLCLRASASFQRTPNALGGEVCTSDKAALAGQLQALSGSPVNVPGIMLVTGLVPDGVTSVSATLADGQTQTVAVHNNVYMLEVAGPVSPTISFSDASGQVTLSSFNTEPAGGASPPINGPGAGQPPEPGVSASTTSTPPSGQ